LVREEGGVEVVEVVSEAVVVTTRLPVLSLALAGRAVGESRAIVVFEIGLVALHRHVGVGSCLLLIDLEEGSCKLGQLLKIIELVAGGLSDLRIFAVNRGLPALASQSSQLCEDLLLLRVLLGRRLLRLSVRGLVGVEVGLLPIAPICI